MKFFNKLRKSPSNDISGNKKTNVSFEDSLNYFSGQGALGRSIVEKQRRVVNDMGEGVESISSLDFDAEMNKELIRENALQKYGTSEQDLSLMVTAWFPRVRNKIKKNKSGDGDNDSIVSSGSDYSQDGFAGPFSWETKSLQEMILPPTPVGERKLIALHQNDLNDSNNNNLDIKFTNNKNKKKKATATMTDNENQNKPSHRTYETIEELRTRLLKNYREAKKQREKYLNISVNKANRTPETSINGYRSKKTQQEIFKNYKLKQDVPKERTTTTISFAVDDDATKEPPQNISFAEELTNAIQRQSEIISSTTITLGGSSKSDSESSNTSTPKVVSPSRKRTLESNTYVIDEIDSSTSKEENLSRKNSTKSRLKRSDSKSEKNEKRKNSLSLKKKSAEKNELITQEDVNNVVENQHSKRDSLYQNSADDGGLTNVMDMLANW